MGVWHSVIDIPNSIVFGAGSSSLKYLATVRVVS